MTDHQFTNVEPQGDQIGRDTLDSALRPLSPDMIGFPLRLTSFGLSLANHQPTHGGVIRQPAGAARLPRPALSAAAIVPQGPGDAMQSIRVEPDVWVSLG
jgi:hypothetical protein